MVNDKRVCLPVSGSCNNNCIFCMDNWQLSDFVGIEEITEKLKAAKGYCCEVSFCSLEPTLHPELEKISSIAQKIGFEKIEIVTNGRKLKDYDYTQKLISSGVNEFNLSLHSYLPSRHDKIVGVSGAFREVVKALKNLMKLKEEYNIKIDIAMTICKENYKDIHNFLIFIEKFNPSSVILNILQPKNKAEENKDRTFIKYSYIIQEFCKSEDILKRYENVYINGMVPCLMEKLREFTGYFNGAQINEKDEKGNYIVEFNSFKTKREKCNYCRYYNSCEGVWKSYIDKFGRDEFEPM